MSKSSLAALLVLSIGACNAFLSSHSLRRLRTSLDAAPPPPPPWNSKITTPSSITGRLGKSAPENPIGEVVCVGDMLYDCIANDDAKGWPIEKVTATYGFMCKTAVALKNLEDYRQRYAPEHTFLLLLQTR